MVVSVGYGSVERKEDQRGSYQPKSSSKDGESQHTDAGDRKKSIIYISAVGVLFWLLAVSNTSNNASRSLPASLLDAMDGNVTGISDIPIPDYLAALDSSDPNWDKYSDLLTSPYIIGDPGKGNMIPGKVNIVKFVKDHFVFRTYGGGASQCGYWWVLDPPNGTKNTYFDHFAICNDWNDASNIIRCLVPAGYVAAAGIGQTVICPDGEFESPDPSNLQLNGNFCTASIDIQKHLACEYCTSNIFLEQSSCSNKGPDYIDNFTFGS